jgi:hypothetical protein
MTFADAVRSIQGLTHYYPLDGANQARDVVGTAHGRIKGDVTFDTHARFDGRSHIELPDHNDFSAATTGHLTILVFATIDDWSGAGASEYVHWMGKGVTGAQEWTFRHYVEGGTGEAAARPKRTSFYHFNPAGGLGAGSYFQDPAAAGVERVLLATVDPTSVTLWKDGVKRDSDALSGYSIKPRRTGAPVRLGTRDLSTGFLVGRLRRVAFFNRVLSEPELRKLYDARSQEEDGAVTEDLGCRTPGESTHQVAGPLISRMLPHL